jgi:hypothetical protein
MTENWSGLISGDYEAVMPLTWNMKYGFKYLYQPYFTKALGVFGKTTAPFDISSFLNMIPEQFRYWDIDLNENNIVSIAHRKLRQYTRTNYFIPLTDDYEQLKHRYKRLAVRMNKKATENNLQVLKGADPGLIIQLFRKEYASKLGSIPTTSYDKLLRCIMSALDQKLADTYLAKLPSGEILAYYIILQDNQFIYSLLGGSSDLGKKLGAFYLLTDHIIRDHAASDKIFRFEGSDVPGISFYNSLFGPEKISYPHVVMNGLPFPFRFFKR